MKQKIKFRIELITIIFILTCFSCGHRSPHYVKIAHEITNKTAKRLEKEKNLHLIGTGGGMMYDVEMMAMSFQYYQEIDLKTARELVVCAISKYLANINHNSKILPFLHECPFTAKSVEIRIWIYNPDRSKPPSGKIQYISAIDGIIDYYTRDSQESYRKTIHEETYEEALKLTQSNTNN